ncbi:hypothetical protein Ancab_035826 [Ancistrocladus abbreviatus]
MGKASEEHSEKCGTTGVGSWPSVIPCTLDGCPYKDCFDSPEKVKVLNQARSQTSPGSHDDELRQNNVAQDCSRKVVHVSHAESSSTAVNRDAIHVLASRTLLKDAFMDDMRGSPGKSEKGKPSETTAGTQSLSQGGGSPSPGLVGGPRVAKLVVLLHLLKPATPAVSVVFAGSVFAAGVLWLMDS